MKLLITIDFAPEHGGIQRYLKSIVQNSFTKKDIILIGCSPRTINHRDNLSARQIRKSWGAAAYNKKLSLFSLFLPFLRIIKNANEPVEVECGNLYAAIIPWAVSFFIKQRYTIHIYGTEIIPLGKRTLKNALFRSILARAEGVYVLTDYIKKLLDERNFTGKVYKKELKLHFPPSRREKPSPSRMYRILTVGRLVPHKGHHILIQAATLFPLSFPWSVHIVGNGPQRESLLRYIDYHSLAERVFLHAKLTDDQVNEQFKAAGMFVFPSLELMSGTEGFGLVQLDAMAHGLAIVASHTGGIPEVLGYGSCGTLIPPANPQALCEAVVDIWKNPKPAQRRICAAYKQVQRFSA